MNLTPENKDYIDSLNYEQLLRHNRFAPCGDKWFQGDTGTYWLSRMAELKAKDPDGAVHASKSIGWERY